MITQYLKWDQVLEVTVFMSIGFGEHLLDNNVTERDIRPFTTGRKNWMFSTSVDGANASANLYSLVMTCRANDMNPYYYFQHLFAELPKRSPTDDVSDLMPWNVEIGVAE